MDRLLLFRGQHSRNQGQHAGILPLLSRWRVGINSRDLGCPYWPRQVQHRGTIRESIHFTSHGWFSTTSITLLTRRNEGGMNSNTLFILRVPQRPILQPHFSGAQHLLHPAEHVSTEQKEVLRARLDADHLDIQSKQAVHDQCQ